MLNRQGRIGRLKTPMGTDVLCLVELTAREGLSQLFDFNIVRDTFADHGLADYRLALTQSFPKLHYTAIRRDRPEFRLPVDGSARGLFLLRAHIRQANAGYRLRLSRPCGVEARASAPVQPKRRASLAAMRKAHVSRRSPRRKLCSGRFEITDYNHLIPIATQLSTQTNTHKYSNGHYEVFDWPSPHAHSDQGDPDPSVTNSMPKP